MSPFNCPFSWRGFGPLPYPTDGSLAHTSFPAAAAAAESVEFDDDVALLLSVAGLVMWLRSRKSEAQTLLHWGHRGHVFGFVEAVWRAARRSSEVVIQPFKKLPYHPSKPRVDRLIRFSTTHPYVPATLRHPCSNSPHQRTACVRCDPIPITAWAVSIAGQATDRRNRVCVCVMSDQCLLTRSTTPSDWLCHRVTLGPSRSLVRPWRRSHHAPWRQSQLQLVVITQCHF